MKNKNKLFGAVATIIVLAFIIAALKDQFWGLVQVGINVVKKFGTVTPSDHTVWVWEIRGMLLAVIVLIIVIAIMVKIKQRQKQ